MIDVAGGALLPVDDAIVRIELRDSKDEDKLAVRDLQHIVPGGKKKKGKEEKKEREKKIKT